MKYPHTRDESLPIFKRATALMSRQSAALNPHSSTIWYEYVSGLNQPLIEAMDERLKKGSLSDDDTEFLYETYVRERQATRVARLVMRLLREVIDRAEDAGADLSRLHKSLEQRQSQLDDTLERAALNAVVAGINGDTQKLRAITGDLSQTMATNLSEYAILEKKLREAEHAAAVDGLTQVLNHRGFESQVQEVVRKYGSLDGSALLYIDIDYFKKINDSYGHGFGNTVLQAIAEVLRTTVRGGDIVGRLGGEEFVVMLPATSLDGARIVAEHIRAAVARYSIHLDKEVVRGLTVSVGVCMGRAAEPLETLLERADRAMYSAKHQGRDRIHVSVEQTDQG